MISERTRGTLVYAVFAVLLLGGVIWWAGSSPRLDDSRATADGRRTVERKLPSAELQSDYGTMVLEPGVRRVRRTDLGSGNFLVSVVCAGAARVRVTLSEVNDSGRLIDCGDDPTPSSFTVGLPGEFYLRIVAQGAPAVFRWTVINMSG